MSRLRQQYPGNYNSSSNIGAEFENIVRYLNAAELGNRTIGEMLGVLFDETTGVFDGPVEMRFDASNGLQYRVGEYTNAEDGWQTIAAAADLKGADGEDIGTLEGPIFYNRQDYVATAAQTVFSYTFEAASNEILVWRNGLLEAQSSYTKDTTNNLVTFTVGCALNDKVTILTVRAKATTQFVRSDLTSAGQAVFPFVHSSEETLMVWRNGILQLPGGGNDYTNDPASDTITMTTTIPNGELITIVKVEDLSINRVIGLMTKADFAPTGLIPYNKLLIANGEIPYGKVGTLSADLATKAKITISATEPSTPASGDLWLDTSTTPNRLRFWDGSQFLLTSPNSSLPSFAAIDANKYVRVNGTGTAYELGNLDLSSRVPMTYIGAASGVASLDSTGKLPTNQLPSIFSAQTIPFFRSGSVTNATYLVQRLYKQRVRIDGITRACSAGSCNVQLAVDGVAVGSVFSVGTSGADSNISPVIEIDATTVGRRLQVIVTSASALTDLEVGISSTTLAT